MRHKTNLSGTILVQVQGAVTRIISYFTKTKEFTYIEKKQAEYV
jgi:hypothetical protein